MPKQGAIILQKLVGKANSEKTFCLQAFSVVLFVFSAVFYHHHFVIVAECVFNSGGYKFVHGKAQRIYPKHVNVLGFGFAKAVVEYVREQL